MPWYRYSSFRGGPPKPFVRVRFWYGVRHVRIVALVDSGAEVSVLDATHAIALRLDRADALVQAAVTASGDAAAVLTWPSADLELEFAGRRFPYNGGFIEFPAGTQPTNLLGRSDFFQQYIVQFWEAAQLMNIDLAPRFSRPSLQV